MKLIALGTGGWIPTETRQTSCYLCDTGEHLIILDTGTGVQRLGRYTDLLNKYNEIHIIYSHYHIDHMEGLCYISNWTKDKIVNIYGPGKALINKECKEVVTTLYSLPYFNSIDSIGKKVKLNDYDLNGFNIGNIKIDITEQIHTGKSFGITIGDYVHYATDTTINENTFNRARNVKLLLHDCWYIKNEKTSDHSSLEDIINMQRRFQLERIGLIHTNPNWNNNDITNVNRMLLDQKGITMVEDKMIFSL